MYIILIDRAAFKVFKKLPVSIQESLIAKTQILKNNPLAGVTLKGKYRNLRSFHLGLKGISYRVIYQVFTDPSRIVIRLADKRENIYKRLEEMKI